MKNYKVKATELYPGMDFYHVEGSGAYSGGEIIIHISIWEVVKFSRNEYYFWFSICFLDCLAV